MAEFKTLSDYFDPVQTAIRVQELGNMVAQKRIHAMQLREALKNQQLAEEFTKAQNASPVEGVFPFQGEPPSAGLPQAPGGMGQPPVGGPQGVTPPAGPAIQPPQGPQGAPVGPKTAPILGPGPQGGVVPGTPGQQPPQGQETAQNAEPPVVQPAPAPQEDPAVARGKKMIGYYGKVMDQATNTFKEDPETGAKVISKVSAMSSNPDVKAAMAQSGIYSYERVADPKAMTVTDKLTKDLSQEEIDYIANNPDKVKGGGEWMRGLKPGKYDIELDVVNGNAIRKLAPASDIKGVLTKEELTNERTLYNVLMNDASPARRYAAKQVIDAMNSQKVAEARALAGARQQDYPSFGQWSRDEKETNYKIHLNTGVPPKFAFGDRRSYTEFQRGYMQWLNENEITPQEAGRRRAQYQADTRSIGNQQRVYDMMSSYVKNLDFQKEELFKNLDANSVARTNLALLNTAIIGYNMRVRGVADESIRAMYLTDLSNDIAKLSTGSSASIAELSQSAQERWAKVHDPALPVAELKKLLNETQIAAHGRLDSAQKAIDDTYTRMLESESGNLTPEKRETWGVSTQSTVPVPGASAATPAAAASGRPEGDVVQALPDPRQYKGVDIYDDVKKVWLRSDGSVWKRVVK